MSTSDFTSPTIIKTSINYTNLNIKKYIGEIKMWAGITEPDGFIWCDGRDITSDSKYESLRSVLGGATNAPDLQSKYICGSTFNNLGNNIITQLPYHNHTISHTNGVIDSINMANISNKYIQHIQSYSVDKDNEVYTGNLQRGTTGYSRKYPMSIQVNNYDAGSSYRTGEEGTNGNSAVAAQHSHDIQESTSTSTININAFSGQFNTIVMNSYTVNNRAEAYFDSYQETFINTGVNQNTSNEIDSLPSYKEIGFIIRYL